MAEGAGGSPCPFITVVDWTVGLAGVSVPECGTVPGSVLTKHDTS